MTTRCGALRQVWVNRSVVVHIVLERSLDSLASHQAVQVRNAFTQPHKHGSAFQFALKKVRQQVHGDLGLHTILFKNQHPVLVMIDESLESGLDAIEGLIVRG